MALIVVIAGPGGVGKGTVVRELIERDPRLWLSRSWTTRERRPGESADAYRFVTRDEFDEHIAANGFLEWAEFQGNRYGTPWPDAPGGEDVILEIDVQGAAQVHEREPHSLLIFLLPPSMTALRSRLEGRGDPPDKVRARLEIAEAERDAAEQLDATEIVNDDLETTVVALQELIEAYRVHPD